MKLAELLGTKTSYWSVNGGVPMRSLKKAYSIMGCIRKNISVRLREVIFHLYSILLRHIFWGPKGQEATGANQNTGKLV